MKKLLGSILLITAIIGLYTPVKAESLFVLNASQSYQASSKSLFSGVRALTIGDMVSIVIDETISNTDTMTYSSAKSTNTSDNNSKFLRKILTKWLKVVDDRQGPISFGGSNTIENSANASRIVHFGDTISAQVVQLLSNGNLVVQGKKTLVNANERMDVIVTGIVDPRWINANGEISSKRVGNLQFAMSGRGSVSRGQNEGIMNRIIKALF